MLKSTLAIAAFCSAFSAAAATGNRGDADALRGDAAAHAAATGVVADQTVPSGLAMVAAGLLVLTGLSRRRGL